jgi:stearoyl-CoA desaturase (delta-9 desaturase)
MKRTFLQIASASIIQWFNADFHATGEVGKTKDVDRINWVRSIPFIILHLGCLGVFLVGWSWTAVTIAAALYFVRMFAITGIYHRYFSHRTFKTSRPAQFIFALLGASATQRGPLWWAATWWSCRSPCHETTRAPPRESALGCARLWSICSSTPPR